MDELIKRQAVLDQIELWARYDVPDVEAPIDLVERILELPSAEPERKKGEWIDVGDPLMIRCSKCDYRVARYNNTNYCPNCGADMRGADDDI